MGPLVAEVAILGLLSGLDPLAFLAVLVVSHQHRRNGVAFVCGWLLTLIVLTIVPAAILHIKPRHGHVTHRTLRAGLLLAFGLFLIAVAVRSRWVGHGHDAEKVPKWYRRLQRVGFKTSFLTGVVLPSFPAAIAAGAAVFRARLGFEGRSVAVVAFLIVSSANVIVPTALLFLSPTTAPAALARVNDWVYRNRHDITFWVLGVIGAFLIIRSADRLL
jgi:hypothetical protein